ncbi:MAG: hypothetical protein P8I51_02810 [Polaribacter sp.]|jgi:uncharacterized membrane protein|nr:hypothetical protein [Polaribacter sp.]MDG1953807.1 hypothetical protein [Polaribacter sp.]
MDVEILGVGILLILLGVLYGSWSYFLKKKEKNPNILSKTTDVQDKILPIILIISGIILVLKNL